MTDRTKNARSVEELEEAGSGEGEEARPTKDAGPEHSVEVQETAEVERSPELDAEYAAEAELRSQMDLLQSEFDTLNDRHLRLAAEFQNYRRRAENEMSEAWSRAQADLVRRLLDVLDDLQRVSTLEPTEDSVSVQSIVEGVDLVERKFTRALKDAGVETIDPKGEPFDPETMEAVMKEPADSPEEDDQVAQVFQKGYMMKGHLIRPARVSVKKHD